MPSAQARVLPTSDQAQSWARNNMQHDNMQGIQFIDFTQDANLARKPDYYLYLFNIAPRKFEVRRPPCWPLITFAACEKGKKYELVGRVPNIVNEVTIVVDRTNVTGYAGERFATDILNPSNTGTDIWREITDEQLSWIDGGTDDLTRRGMFWSRNEVPTEDELRRCRDRMERHYKQLLLQADQFSRENRLKEIGPEHHLAADHFHYKAAWHTVAEAVEFCPNCGDPIRPGLAYHATAGGVICVIDWQRAVSAGVKKKEDVPEDARWWDMEVKRGPGRPRKDAVEEVSA